ncbi:MAG: GntR family transcriptional regulator [Bacillota bacterium]|nr:GntR family transcriptional regulator [Bacillota bacterium]
MRIEQDSIKPIYVQIAEGIEDDILKGVLEEDEQAYSQYQISKQFNVNPATAAKGINVLVAEGILYKKRGLGMHVAQNARVKIEGKRKKNFFSGMLKELMSEARKLNINKEELKKMIDDFKGGDENE